MWKALSARDWDSLKTFLSDDCIYLDMPVGPTAAARGPEDIVKRLKIGLEPLASYENFDGLMVDNGADVDVRAPRGMALAHRRIRGPEVRHACTGWRTARSRCGRTTGTWARWPTIAPPTWLEDFANADMSWVFDATGLV